MRDSGKSQVKKIKKNNKSTFYKASAKGIPKITVTRHSGKDVKKQKRSKKQILKEASEESSMDDMDTLS